MNEPLPECEAAINAEAKRRDLFTSTNICMGSVLVDNGEEKTNSSDLLKLTIWIILMLSNEKETIVTTKTNFAPPQRSETNNRKAKNKPSGARIKVYILLN